MRVAVFYLTLFVFLFGCSNTNTESSSEITRAKSAEVSKIGNRNYAVVWNWATADEKLVADNAPIISKELTSLWKKGIVENAYYNTNASEDKLSYFPNISFSLKAESYESAEVILDNLTVVKKGVARYNLFPIGALWLDRKHKVIVNGGATKSFATVWTTESKPTDELTKLQMGKIIELWETGEIENVYFDVEGVLKKNNKTDFVFYANANSESDAIAICESLPFFKEKVATYKIFEVGVFWMGKYEQK